MLGRHRSTAYREISRNFYNDLYAEFRGWFPTTAGMRARRRRCKTSAGPPERLTSEPRGLPQRQTLTSSLSIMVRSMTAAPHCFDMACGS